MTERLENTNEKIKYVTSIINSESNETKFFIVSAKTENGDHQYIFGQDKKTGELEFISKIK